MLVLWLIFMGLFVAALALPLAQRFAYAYGQWGSLRDHLRGIARALLNVLGFSAVMGLIGLVTMGQQGLVEFALAGAMMSLLGLVALSTYYAGRALPQPR